MDLSFVAERIPEDMKRILRLFAKAIKILMTGQPDLIDVVIP
jgi:hypothetical protein